MTGKEIVERANSLLFYKYWYGGKGEVATRELADRLRKENPNVWTNSYYKKAVAMIGESTRVADCSYLVCYAYGRKSQIGSSQIRNNYHVLKGDGAKPGMIAWRSGHVGIIIDESGHMAEMRGIDYGFMNTRTYKNAGMTHILYDKTVDYGFNNGWIKDGDRWMYFLGIGVCAAGDWYIINNHWWYFDNEGYLLTGPQWINNQLFYIDENLGCLISDQYGALVPWFVRGERHNWQTITM